MPQPREAMDDFHQHERRAIAILHVGGMDHGMNEIAIGVGQDVALAAFDLLACMVAPRAAALRGFDALAIDYPCAGRGLVSYRFPADEQQGVIEREPHSFQWAV